MALPNRPNQVSTNVAALNEHLVRDPKPVEAINFPARIDAELAALTQAVDEFNNDQDEAEAATETIIGG